LKKINLFFEMKSMGWSFLLPLLVFLILIYQLVTYKGLPVYIYKTLEFLIAPFTCWWIIYLYYEYFEGELQELIPCYPLSSWYHGIYRVLTFTFIYLLLLLSVLWFVHSVIEGQHYIPLLLYFGSLSWLFAAFGFLLVSICRTIIPPIVIITTYVVTEFLTNGEVIPWYHAIAFVSSPFSIEDVAYVAVTNGLLSVFFLFLGHIILSLVLYKGRAAKRIMGV